jgi:hypothetical protein
VDFGRGFVGITVAASGNFLSLMGGLRRSVADS